MPYEFSRNTKKKKRKKIKTIADVVKEYGKKKEYVKS